MIANPRELNQAVTFLHENGMFSFLDLAGVSWGAGLTGAPAGLAGSTIVTVQLTHPITGQICSL